MSMHNDAIQRALAAFREPVRMAELRERPLPHDVGTLIRIAAGEAAALDAAEEGTGEPRETLVEASVFFLQQVLFAPSANAYRTLGASPDAPQEQLREHYRWLMRWLHPDRNTDGWEVVYADRVNAAWQLVKTETRRAEYDAQLAAGQMVGGIVPVARTPLRVTPSNARAPMLSGGLVRRLPALILGSLAVLAAATLGLMYLAREDAREQAAAAARRAEPLAATGMPVAPPADRAPVLPATTPDDPLTAQATAGDPLQQDTVAPDGDAMILSAEPSPAVATGLAVATTPVPKPIELAAVSADPPPTDLDPAPPISPAQVAIVDTPQRPTPPAPAAAPARPAAPAPQTPPVAAVPPSRPQQRTDAIATAAPVAGKDPVPAAAVPATQGQPARLAAATPPRQEPPPALAPATAASRGTGTTATAAASKAPADPVATAAASPAQADALVSQMVAAYAAGNLQRFDSLFTGTVRQGGSLRQRMQETQMRYLELGQVRWRPAGELLEGHASYRDTYVQRGERRASTETGEMRWTLREDAGDWRFASVELSRAGAD